MILLSARELSRQFDAEPVFADVTFDIRPGERIGLVGPNGTGKTTLLRILAGMDHADRGEVEKPARVSIELLEQRPKFPPERTLLDEAKSGLSHLYALQEESHRLAEAMANTQGEEEAALHARFDELQEELSRKNAYSLDHRIDEILVGLGFSKDDYDRPLTEFSGGQQSRILLARILLHAPDVMLLDEPTNHLDIATTEWLEDYLARVNSGVILVSHDRYFLDRVTTRIIELLDGRMSDYKGNFSAYWTQREERQKVAQRTFEKQQEFIARTEDFIRKNQYGQKHAQASDRVKKLERLERVDLIRDLTDLPMAFGEAERSGDMVVEAKEIAKGFDDGPALFSGLSLRIDRGERVGILGANGTGKTTLLRVLLGELPPDAGTTRLGANVKVGYYDQQLSSVDPRSDAIEAVRPEEKPEMTPGSIRSILARFGIQGDLALAKVFTMSGGETSKVALAKIAARDINLLVLDEPTNHLDLWAAGSLEKALKKFGGTLLFVSHDRYFLDRVATRVIVFEPDQRLFLHGGNWSQYVAFRKSVHGDVPTAQLREKKLREQKETDDRTSRGRQPQESSTARKRKFPYRKTAEIEEDIAEKEAELEVLESAMSDPDLHRDPDRLRETMDAYEETKIDLEMLYEHWEEAVELN